MKIIAPWDYSDPKPGEPVLPNLPSPEGAALGAQLARLCDERESALRIAQKLVPLKCSECAFRRGEVANQCASTLMDIIKCLTEHEPFYCHIGIADEDEPLRICAGYTILSTEP